MELKTTNQVIDFLGGNIPVAKLTGSNAKAVSMWKTNGSFPARTFVALTRELRKRDVSCPARLWRMKGLARGE